jgi:CubicO group peptidase (beta-lactamase class C family)
MVRGLLCVALLFVTVTAHAETWPDKEWANGAVLSGPAVDALNAYAFPARDDVTRKGIRTDALLVIRDGEIIYERYGAPTTASTPHLTWSVSKSLMATVLGVAYGENRFKLTDLAARFYPPMKQHPKVTIADLLHWASGLDWQEDYEYAPLKSSVVAMLYTRGRGDMADFAADTEAVNAPGQAFRYSSGEAVPGGHWWLNKGEPRPWPDAPADTFAALGHWGQALFVMPDEHLVIVRYGDDRDGSYRHNELLKRVLAAVQP